MTYRGRVKGGVIVLTEKTELAEGTEVQIELIDESAIPTIAERFANFIGKAEGLPEDFAENHDHYIHGAPKKNS